MLRIVLIAIVVVIILGTVAFVFKDQFAKRQGTVTTPPAQTTQTTTPQSTQSEIDSELKEIEKQINGVETSDFGDSDISDEQLGL